MELVAIDDFIFSDFEIKPAMLTNQSSHLTFGSDRRAGVYSSVYFSSSSSTASWHVIIQCPDDRARNALTCVLATPTNRELRLLVLRERNTDDYVSINASVNSVQPTGSSNDFEVTFDSNDSVWHADIHESVSKVFSNANDQVLHLPSPGNVPTNPVIRLLPTLQRATTTANVGWKYRQRYTISNNVDEPIYRYPVMISLGNTATLVSASKALASGNDLRVWLDGIEQPRSLVGWNTSNTRLWIIVPALNPGESTTYDVVYGNLAVTTDGGCALAHPDIPAFDLTQSDNLHWYYRTGSDINRAGQGLWVLTSDNKSGSADFTVPGAWRPGLTFSNPTNTDEYFQGPSRRNFVDQVETITSSGSVTGGSYTITFQFNGGITPAIAYNASNATIQSAIATTIALYPEGVTVTGGPLPGTPVAIDLRHPALIRLTGQQMTITSSLTGGGTYTMAVTTPIQTYFQATMNASRWRGDPVNAVLFQIMSEAVGSYPFDGVVIHNPFGITRVTTGSSGLGISVANIAKVKTVVTTTVGATTASDEVLVPHAPYTRMVVIGRDSGGDDWRIISERTKEEPVTNISSTDWTVPGTYGMKHFGVAIWPSEVASIPDDAQASANVLINGDTTVYLATGSERLDIVQVEAEAEIYELATELRLGGGANALGSYHTLLVGNARELIGPGTPRAAVRRGTQGLEIDTSRHTHDIWDINFLDRQESLSAHAVRGLDGYLHDGVSGESRASYWLPVTPPRRTIANGDFAVGLDSWEFEDVTGGVVAATTWDGAIGASQPGSFKINVTTNPSIGQVIFLNSQVFTLNGWETIELSAQMRISVNTMRPRLAMYWYQYSPDDGLTLVGTDKGPFYSVGDPPVNTWMHRSCAFQVFAGATRFRVGVMSDLSNPGATGTVWFDDVRINDADLFVSDVVMGQLLVQAFVPPQWVP